MPPGKRRGSAKGARGVHAHPDLKLGLIPADPVDYARMITVRLTGGLPTHPLVANHLAAVPVWCLGANDRFGTCGPTSLANYLVLLYKVLTGEDITVTNEAIFALYKLSGNPGFDPVTGAGDGGVQMPVMLDALMKNGLDIIHADGTVENIRPVAYGKALPGLDPIRATAAIMGGTILAATLDVAQQGQSTEGGLWDYVPQSRTWGGHAFMCGAYTSSSAPHSADLTDVTWAMKVGASDEFVAEQVEEAYAVIFPVLWDHPGLFLDGIDTTALAADFAAVTGRPLPAPGPVPPPPPPAPPVVDAAVAAFLGDPDVSAFETARHYGRNRRVAQQITALRRAE